MNPIKILWMYDDLLDLYGDWGNLLAIGRAMDVMGVSWELTRKSLGDLPNFSDYQMVYLGPGKTRNLVAAAKDFVPQKQAVLQAVEDGVLFLVTGNSRLLFGAEFSDAAGVVHKGIELFSYTGQDNGEVFISDVLAHPVFRPEVYSYGFINRTAFLSQSGAQPLFLLESGAGDGNDPAAKTEGDLYKNFFGTWQLGPILVKNPEFLKEILRRLCGESYKNFDTMAEELSLKLTVNEMLGR